MIMIDREQALKQAREMSTKRLEEKDVAITNAVYLINDLHEAINILSERLTIWYFKGQRKMNADPEILGKISQLPEASEFNQMKKLAEQIQSLMKFRDSLNGYIAATAKEIMPNTTFLVGEVLAAHLLSRAGSLEKLSKMPASTIQVLGAEKSLFKHLRKGAKSPKHGVIFAHPSLNKSPRHVRGKIARVIAAKLSFAIRADFTTKRFIADKLKEDMDKKIQAIISSAPTKAAQTKGR